MFIMLSVFVPVIAALITVAIRKQFGIKSFRQWYVTVVLVLNFIFVLMANLRGGNFVLFHLTDTLTIHFHVDELSTLFTTLVSVMWLLSGIFSFEYSNHMGHRKGYYFFYMVSLGVLNGIGFAANYMTLYLFYEMMTLLTMPLVLHERTQEAVSAALKYLFYSIFGASLALIGFFFVHAYGTSTNFTPGGVISPEAIAENEAALMVVFFLTIVGFCAKAGMFPLHGWLPSAHPVAPAPASAVLSGIITKAGVVAVSRVVFYIIGVDILRDTWVQYAWMILAMITIFMGSMMAYRENVLKKRLAYSSVSQVSYVLFGLATMTESGMIGAFLQMVFHSIAKDGLFLSAGAIIYKTGYTLVEDLKGIGKRMPVVMWCFTVVALSLIGIPPICGFISKWYLAHGSLTSGMGHFTWAGPAMLLVSAFLTAGYLLPISIHAFLPGHDFDYNNIEKCEPNAYMTVPLIILAALSIICGLFSGPLIDFVALIPEAVL